MRSARIAVQLLNRVTASFRRGFPGGSGSSLCRRGVRRFRPQQTQHACADACDEEERGGRTDEGAWPGRLGCSFGALFNQIARRMQPTRAARNELDYPVEHMWPLLQYDKASLTHESTRISIQATSPGRRRPCRGGHALQPAPRLPRQVDVLEHEQASAGDEHTAQLGTGLDRIGDATECEDADGGVEAGGRERKSLRRPFQHGDGRGGALRATMPGPGSNATT